MMLLYRCLCTLFMTLLLTTPSLALTLKIATIAPEGSTWMETMRQGAEEISRRTANRVTFKFYGGGVMGNEKSVLRKIRIGQLHGGVFTGGGIAEVYPDIRLYGLPLMFRSSDEVDAIRPRFDPLLMKGLKEAGFISFGLAEGGFALLMGNSPVSAIHELQGKKVWVPEGDQVSYATMEALGLSPVTLPVTDVMTGLQTGLLDVVATSPVGAIAFQWHTRVKFINPQPLAYLFAGLMLDKRAFMKITPEDQKVVSEVMTRIYADFDHESRKDNAEALDALKTAGLSLQQASREDLAKLLDTAARVNKALTREEVVSSALYDALQTDLDTLRRQQVQ